MLGVEVREARLADPPPPTEFAQPEQVLHPAGGGMAPGAVPQEVQPFQPDPLQRPFRKRPAMTSAEPQSSAMSKVVGE